VKAKGAIERNFIIEYYPLAKLPPLQSWEVMVRLRPLAN